MKDKKLKLLSAFVVFLVSLVMVVSGTYAWMTINQTTTEVSGMQFTLSATGDEWPFEFALSSTGEYTKSVRLTDLFTRANLNSVTLNPISTYDGSKWYSASYDDDGNVKGLDEVNLADVSTNISYGASEENFRTDSSNCVVYFDVWVKTKDKKATIDHPYQLKLSNPLSTDNIMEEEDEYGSFVVGLPEKTVDGSYVVTQSSIDATTCIRIGFQPRSAADGLVENFVIYEPNSTLRSSTFVDNPAEGQVKYVFSESSDILVAGHADNANGVAYGTKSKLSNGSYDVYPNTIRQAASYWDEDALSSPDFRIHSENVHIGVFEDDTWRSTPTGYEGIDTMPIMELYCDEDGEPVPKILRVYIWLEGQDIDCWNKIALGKIYSHLEFRGDFKN